MDPKTEVCQEIVAIMECYHEQEKSSYGVDTPGGLEHMGDVWALFSKWEMKLSAAQAEAPESPRKDDDGLPLCRKCDGDAHFDENGWGEGFYTCTKCGHHWMEDGQASRGIVTVAARCVLISAGLYLLFIFGYHYGYSRAMAEASEFYGKQASELRQCLNGATEKSN